MSPSPMENEYRCNCAQGQWLPGPHCEGFHEWELEAHGSYGKLLATAAHLQKAWCSAHHSREDFPHSLGACSPEGFFFFCDLFFCNLLRVRYSTRFQVNGEVEWKSKNEDCQRIPFNFLQFPATLRQLSEIPSTPHPKHMCVKRGGKSRNWERCPLGPN